MRTSLNLQPSLKLVESVVAPEQFKEIIVKDPDNQQVIEIGNVEGPPLWGSLPMAGGPSYTPLLGPEVRRRLMMKFMSGFIASVSFTTRERLVTGEDSQAEVTAARISS